MASEKHTINSWCILNTDTQSVPQQQSKNERWQHSSIEDEEEFKKLLQINQSIDSPPFNSQTTNQKSNKHSTWMVQMAARMNKETTMDYTMIIYLTYNIS